MCPPEPTSKNKLPHTDLLIGNTHVSLMIDSGARVNLIDEKAYKELNQPTLTQTSARIHPYGCENPLHVYGKFTASIKTLNKDKHTNGTFYVVAGNHGSLLSYTTATELGLLNIPVNQIKNNSDDVIGQFPEVFSNQIGKVKNFQVHLHINNHVKPVKQTHRRIPFHMRKHVEQELANLENQDIIEKVTGPTPWVSPVVIIPKTDPSEIRICIDMREANKAIERERHLTPTIDDLIHDLNGAKYFSHLDLRAGYHQLELDEESRKITTFSTHVGLRRYKRLIFGISSASEIFQHTIEQILSDISGVRNISDDIIVYGTTKEEHDQSLKSVLSRLKDSGITIQAICNCDPPENVSELRSLLGMATYCARFIKDYSSLVHPLRELTKQGVPWSWGIKEQTALDKLKQTLASDTCLSYFNPERATEIYVDASPTGLSGILVQRDKHDHTYIIGYGSRSLTDPETRYSQTEREALAVSWSVQHYHLYVYGNPFTVITDHKPLVTIFNKPNSRPPLRIERWCLKLQPYKFEVKYEPGKLNPADYMSRHPIEDSTDTSIAEDYVCYISENSVPKSMTLQEVRDATLSDKTLQEVAEFVKNGKWYKIQNEQDKEELLPYNKVKEELTVSPNSDLILRGQRLIIPKLLQQRAVDIAHEGHFGISRTKALLRGKIWFPGVDNLVEKTVKMCV